MNLIENQIKYGYIKAVNFTTDQGTMARKKMQQKSIQYIMMENLLLLKDLLEPQKNEIYKYMTSIQKMCILTNQMTQLINTKIHNHRTIKMKLVDVKPSIYIDSGDNVRIYKNIFAKGYIPNWYEEDFAIKKIKNTVPWTFVISILTEKKLLDHFTKNNYKKQIKKS